MNKKMIERIAVFALAAFSIGYFVYQVAYGMTMPMNGTMTTHTGPQRDKLIDPLKELFRWLTDIWCFGGEGLRS